MAIGEGRCSEGKHIAIALGGDRIRSGSRHEFPFDGKGPSRLGRFYAAHERQLAEPCVERVHPTSLLREDGDLLWANKYPVEESACRIRRRFVIVQRSWTTR